MKFSVDHFLYGLAAAVVGGAALSLSAYSSPAPGQLEQRFSPEDYAAFDRNFELSGDVCTVGVRERGLCFSESHLEDRVVKGETFPANMYPLALEWRADLRMPRKPNHLKTVRIGQTVALMDRETRMIVDTMQLDALDFATATQTTRG